MTRLAARAGPWLLLAAAAAAYVATLVLTARGSVADGDGITAVITAWLAYAVIGAVVAARRPENAVGWVLLAMGVCGVVLGCADALQSLGAARPDLVLPFLLNDWVLGLVLNLWVVSFALIGVLVLLFPTGRPPTERWRPYLWVTGVLIVLGLVTSGSTAGSLGAEGESTTGFPLIPALFAPDLAAWLIDAGQSVVGIGLMVLAAAAVASLVVRFRRSAGIERQQLKWFAFAASLFVFVYVVTSVSFFVPQVRALDPEVTIPVAMFGGIPFILALTLLPVSVGIAILRYRLYDIDVLINRTLVYGAVTAVLGASYVGSVLLLQTALRPLTGGSELAVAISTLVVFALFQPIRRRIQDAVDRRFYRSRYDAQRTLDAFTARLRNEVDLGSLERELVGAVEATLQPRHASVWIRQER